MLRALTAMVLLGIPLVANSKALAQESESSEKVVSVGIEWLGETNDDSYFWFFVIYEDDDGNEWASGVKVEHKIALSKEGIASRVSVEWNDDQEVKRKIKVEFCRNDTHILKFYHETKEPYKFKFIVKKDLTDTGYEIKDEEAELPNGIKARRVAQCP